jgi:hypothetical protein
MALQFSEIDDNPISTNNKNKTRRRKMDYTSLNHSNEIAENSLLNKSFAPSAFNEDEESGDKYLGNSNPKYEESNKPEPEKKFDGPTEYEQLYNQANDVLSSARNKSNNDNIQEPITDEFQPSSDIGQYRKQYENTGYYNTQNQADPNNQPIMLDNKLLEKINYMIRLFEDNRDEKSGNVTEEVILYCFLGIFMIFVIDAFVKVGKYTR